MIKVITGPMFSEKSDHLIKEYEDRHHKDMIMVFKPKIDTRDENVIRARGKSVIKKNGKEKNKKNITREIPAIIIDDIAEIMEYLLQKKEEGKDISTILIDEGNFLRGDVTILRDLSLYADIDIIISGLNQDRFQNPFGLMPALMSLADEIVYLTASCNNCNRPANLTIMKDEMNDSKEQDVVGDQEHGYMATCPRCLSRKASNKYETPQGMSLVLRVREKDGSSK